MKPQFIRQGYLRHAALCQLHRWYLFYEEPRTGLKNQLDLLASDVIVRSGLGEARGHDAYESRVKQLPLTWENAHHIKSTDVAIADDGQMRLTAAVTYLNRGMLPDGDVRKAELTYETTLSPTENLLPRFSTIGIRQDSEGQSDNFTPEYAANRLLSLVHYWFAIIEDPKRDPAPAREIFADGFSLNFSTGPISSFEGFKAWLAGPGSQVAASTHEIADFKCAEAPDGIYKISMDLDWEGILPNGAEMIAKTQHVWTVENDPAERFAQIKSVDVTILLPFTLKV